MNNMRYRPGYFSGLTLTAALLTCGPVMGQTTVNLELNAPTYNAGNSTDSYQITSASLGGATIDPDASFAQQAGNVFNAAVLGLNAGPGSLGSAENYQQARANLDVNPADPALQEAFARSQAQYSQYLTTVNNLRPVVTLPDPVEVNTFNGFSGAPIVPAEIPAGQGAIEVALEAAQEASGSINEAVDYYQQGAGASTPDQSYADLQGEVIVSATI